MSGAISPTAYRDFGSSSPSGMLHGPPFHWERMMHPVYAVLATVLMLTSACGTQPAPSTQAEVNSADSDAETRGARSAQLVTAPPFLWARSAPEAIAPDGPVRHIGFEGRAPIRLEAVRITGRKPGVIAICAVRIEGRLIETVGAPGSPSEVLECHRLETAGALPPDKGRRRLGLIYASGSPSAAFRAPVVLREQGDGWEVDDAAVERFESGPAPASIAGMARILAGKQ